MPYARNADLPAQVRNPLPDPAQTVFRGAVNAALNQGEDETSAFRIAWAAVGRQFKPTQGGKWIHKHIEGNLFVKRILENPFDLIDWAEDQGFNSAVIPRDMHATIVHSKAKVKWPEPDDDHIVIKAGKREVTELGGEGAVVLKFHSPTMKRRFKELCDEHGCESDHDEYISHVTFTYDKGEVDLSKVKAYDGQLVFGPEVFEPINEEVEHVEKGKKVAKRKDIAFNISKYNKKLGLVFGWAIVCKEKGEDYYDLQGDHIPEDAMLEAAADFMQKRRTMKVMHKGEKAGTIVFAWPLTTEVSKAMGVTTKTTGLMVAAKPEGSAIIKAIEAGKLTGFSIGGSRIDDEEVD